jgi:hypothetical protein
MIEKLIITSPYEEPRQHYSYVRETRSFALKEGRRSAGYIVASEASRTFDDPGVFIELPLVNQIRSRVKTKRRFLDEWVRAVNAHSGFGSWEWAVSRDTADVSGIIEKTSRKM